MPFDGNGIYNPLSPPIFPAVGGTTITANQYNQQILDIGSALSNCITRDGQSPPTTDIPMNNHKLTGLLAPTLGGDAANKTYVDGQDTTTLTAARDLVRYRTGFRGLWGQSTASSTLQLTCDRVWLRNGAGDLRQVTSGATLSLDLTISAAAGGRDQAGNFASQFIYIYYIYNPTSNTLALIASASSSAPALPTGYTDFAFAMAVYILGTNAQNGGWQLTGNYMNFQMATQALFTGSIATNTSAPHTAMVNSPIIFPPISGIITDLIGIAAPTGGGAVFAVWNTTASGRRCQWNFDGSASVNVTGRVPWLAGNSLRAEIAGASGSPTLSLWAAGYWFPNGAM